jgi:hypothetical protein
MAYGDELNEKLAELRRAALDAYDEWITTRTMNDLTINDERTRVVEDQGVVYNREETINTEQEAFDQFREDLQTLLDRFAKYESLDQVALSTAISKLCRRDVSELGGHWGADPYSGERPSKVADRIYYAGGIVLQLSEPDDLRATGLWHGPAADSFNDNFLDPFGEFAARQIFCTNYLANVVRVFRNATRRTQNDVKAIANASISAFRHEGGSLSEDLSDASLMADLAAFVLPEPLDTLADVGSIALGQAADAADENVDPPEWSVEGSGNLDPYEALESTMGVLTRLEERLARDDDRIHEDLDQDVTDFFYSMRFETRPQEPAPPSRFEGEFLEVNIAEVYEYGAYYLPTAAAHFDEAQRQLHECVIPEWFGELMYPRSQSEFTMARNGLRPALVWTSDYLTDAGDALVTICNEYVIRDAEIAASFEQFKADLPPPADVSAPQHPQRPPRDELPNPG